MFRQAMFSLSYNLIKSIQTDSFYTLINLKDLRLSSNLIKSFDERVFADENQLQNLDLKYNKIANMSYFKASNLNSLQTLSFKNNYLSSFNFKDLASIQSLTSLDLSMNQIRYSDSDTTKTSFENLKFLDFSYMSLIEFRMDDLLTIFKGVHILSLDFNEITNLTNEYQNQLSTNSSSKIQNLSLQYNLLTGLSKNVFINLNNLQALNFHGNMLKSFQNGVLNGLGSLLYLDLSKNLIHSIESGVF
jgi:Leucine-rich repeat (LRR) protein